MVHCKSYDAYCFSCPSYDTRIPNGTRVAFPTVIKILKCPSPPTIT